MSSPSSSPEHDHEPVARDPRAAGGGPATAPGKRTLTQGLPTLRGRERAVAQFDVASDYREDRATIAGPAAPAPDRVADDGGGYREDRATIAGLPAGQLDEHQLRQARRRNPHWHRRLGFSPAAFGGGAVDSAELAEHVAARQAEHGLLVDGIAGPKTVAALGAEHHEAVAAEDGGAVDDPFGMHLLG